MYTDIAEHYLHLLYTPFIFLDCVFEYHLYCFHGIHDCDFFYTLYSLCIYMRKPRRCSVESSHSQPDVVATSHLIGKINKGINEYRIPSGRSTNVLGNINMPPPSDLNIP